MLDTIRIILFDNDMSHLGDNRLICISLIKPWIWHQVKPGYVSNLKWIDLYCLQMTICVYKQYYSFNSSVAKTCCILKKKKWESINRKKYQLINNTLIPLGTLTQLSIEQCGCVCSVRLSESHAGHPHGALYHGCSRLRLPKALIASPLMSRGRLLQHAEGKTL